MHVGVRVCVCVCPSGVSPAFIAAQDSNTCAQTPLNGEEVLRKGTHFHLSGKLFRNIWCHPDAKMVSAGHAVPKQQQLGG